MKNWFLKSPVRFFIFGFVLISSFVLILDIFYLNNWGDVLVEAHGLVFDLFVFGIILTIYESFQSKNDKVERYKEELDDYRGWTENEAAYRVSGIIRRLKKEGVKDINLNNLHLGQCEEPELLNAIGSTREWGFEIASLQGANLIDTKLIRAYLSFENLCEAVLISVDLSESQLGGCNLSKAYLVDCNFKNADMTEVNLDGAMVDCIDWFQKLDTWNVRGKEKIKQDYELVEGFNGITKVYYVRKK